MTTATAQTTQVYQLFIKATPERIWEAITTPEFTARYFHAARIQVTAERYLSNGPDGSTWGDGPVFEFDPQEFSGINPQYWYFWIGLLLVAVVMFLPNGILGGLSALYKKRQ